MMIFHTLNMCACTFGTFDKYFLIFRAVEQRHFFHPKCLGGVWFVYSVTLAVFIPLRYECSHIEHVLPIFLKNSTFINKEFNNTV